MPLILKCIGGIFFLLVINKLVLKSMNIKNCFQLNYKFYKYVIIFKISNGITNAFKPL